MDPELKKTIDDLCAIDYDNVQCEDLTKCPIMIKTKQTIEKFSQEMINFEHTLLNMNSTLDFTNFDMSYSFLNETNPKIKTDKYLIIEKSSNKDFNDIIFETNPKFDQKKLIQFLDLNQRRQFEKLEYKLNCKLDRLSHILNFVKPKN